MFGHRFGDGKLSSLRAWYHSTEDLFPKIAGKYQISIIDNGFQHAMQFEYVVHKEFHQCACYVWIKQGHKVGVLAQSIHHDHDHIPTHRTQQPFYKINTNLSLESDYD